MPEDKALQTIPNTTSVGNEAIDDSSQEERQPEAEFTEKFNKELQAPHICTPTHIPPLTLYYTMRILPKMVSHRTW